MKQFKKLNQFEYLGLVLLLKKPFPFIEDVTCGTCNDNLINLSNTYTENHPNNKFSMLGAFGLTEGHDILLEFWDEEQDDHRLYRLTFRDLRDYDEEGYEPFNCLLETYEIEDYAI